MNKCGRIKTYVREMPNSFKYEIVSLLPVGEQCLEPAFLGHGWRREKMAAPTPAQQIFVFLRIRIIIHFCGSCFTFLSLLISAPILPYIVPTVGTVIQCCGAGAAGAEIIWDLELELKLNL